MNGVRRVAPGSSTGSRHAPLKKLRLQQQLAGRLPPVQVAMGLGGVGQLVDVLDAEFQLARPDPAEDVVAALQQLLAGGGVVAERRAGGEERALRVQELQVERRDRAAGGAEEDLVAPR